VPQVAPLLCGELKEAGVGRFDGRGVVDQVGCFITRYCPYILPHSQATWEAWA